MTTAASAGPASGQATAARPKGERAGAIVIDKNRATAKRLARVLVSAGYAVKTFEDEAPPIAATVAADPSIGTWLLLGEAAASPAILGALAKPEHKRCRGVLYGCEGELDVPALCEQPAVVALLGQRSGAGRELETELLGVASYLRGQPLMPMQAYLLWGAQAFSTSIINVGGRDAAEARIVKLCKEQLSISGRVADSIAEVVHELITNAMYDAPVDASGRALYAHDRTANITLPADDKVTFRYGTDGMRLVVETADRFGRLRRSDLVKSLRRAAAGQINRSQGGAGIGLSMVVRTAQAVQVDVEPGARTRVTAVLDLDVQRPGAAAGAAGEVQSRPARSIIFPDLPPPAVSRPVSST